MNFQFAIIFITQCGPLIATLLVGAVAWVLIKTLLQSLGCSARRYSRQQSLWSNWS